MLFTAGHQLYNSQTGCKSEIKHRFEITKKLGSGTYGKVSLAYDRKNEREVLLFAFFLLLFYLFYSSNLLLNYKIF